jgi:hypothetical protein
MPKRPSAPAGRPPESPDAVFRDLKRMLSQQQFESIDEVNAFLHQITGTTIGAVPATNDRERAEDLVLSARVERSAARQRKMINDALALDGDCVSAHMLLAELADTPSAALAHASNAVAAGERALGPALTDEHPMLWGDPVGREWLIARGQLAELCWLMGDRPRAIAEARDVLARNPGDNQGMRYVLLQWLMRAGALADIDQLLGSYDDDASAAWQFTTALHRYRTQGATAEATRTLRAAVTANRFVVPLLLGTREMPTAMSAAYTLGGEEEAALYVESALTLWLEAGDALGWAESVAASQPTTRRAKKR